MRALLALALIACGSKPPPKPVVEGPVEKPAPPCAPAGPIELPADGALRCKELPVSVTFPPGTKLSRQNDRAMTLYSAALDRGAMALIAEPRADTPTAPQFLALLESLVRGIAADAVTTRIDAPPREGATISVGLAFTTPDGGAGVVHGYFANHWLIAAVAGGRLATTPTRPDQPVGKAFLASLALHPLVTGNRRHPLAAGASIELPASAWSIGRQQVEDGVVSEELFMSPAHGVWIGVRELEMRDRCDYLKGKVAGAPADIGERLKVMFSNAQHPLARIEQVPLGDIGVYAEADSPTAHVVLYFVCAGKTVLQLSVVGERPAAELRTHLDTFVKSLVGAK